MLMNVFEGILIPFVGTTLGALPNYNLAIDVAKGNEGKLSKNFSSNYRRSKKA